MNQSNKTNELWDLTNPQKSIWQTEQFFKGTAINTISGTIRISEVVHFEKLKLAIQIFLRDNDCFRTRILLDESGTPKQYMVPYVENLEILEKQDSSFCIPIMDLTFEEDLLAFEKKMAKTVFSIIQKPLFCVKMFRFSNGHGGFVFTAHHLVADACTAGLVGTKIMHIYSSLLKGEPPCEPPTSYLSYIQTEKEYLMSSKFEKDKTYWESAFETVPELGSIPSFKLSQHSCLSNRKSFILSKEKVDAIQAFCSSHQFSIFNFFMGIYAIYISKVASLNDFVIGTPILNRFTFMEKNTPGMFISTIPFRFSITDSLNVCDFMKQIAVNALGMFRHQKYPYQNILEHLRKQNTSIPNLYDILISYQNTKVSRNSDDVPYSVNWTSNDCVADSMQIHLYDTNAEGSLIMAYDYRVDTYEEEQINQIHHRISYMIEQVLQNDTLSIDAIDICLPSEKSYLLHTAVSHKKQYDFPENILEVIEKNATLYPKRIAIEMDNQSISYAALLKRVAQYANFLLSHSIGEGENVGVFTARSIDTIVAILAILKINATYVPIDPTYPADRISYMIDTANLSYIVLQQKEEARLNGYSLKKIFMDFSCYENMPSILSHTFSYNKQHNLYIIFTSGSTGKPKGVTISHQNMMNLIFFEKEETPILSEESTRILQFATMSFDVSYQEIFSALLFGGTLVLVTDSIRKNMQKLADYILEKQINILFIPPAYLRLLVEDNSIVSKLTKTLQHIITAGEALMITKGMETLLEENILIHNHYGPAETHVATTFTLDKHNICSYPPIGKPISNSFVYILDKHLRLCPPGVIGQIAIAGDCVGNGYWNRVDLTNEKFIVDAYSHQRMYLTGDLGYWNEDNNICFIGRSDFQVKINGFRIELEEIDQILLKYPSILSSVSIVQEDFGKKHIISYYTAKDRIDVSQLQAYLKEKLPFYMIPHKLVLLEAFPLNPNGKIDKKKLPKVDFTDCQETFIAPSTKIEQQLANILQDLFHIEKVGKNSHFFEMGGDSLLAIQLCSLVFSTFDVDMGVSDIFANPTLETLANFIENHCKTTAVVIPKAPVQKSYPLSSAQRRIYYASKSISEKNVVYNVPAAFLIEGSLDKQTVLSCFEQLVNNYSSLRTCFRMIVGEVRQVVLDKVAFGIETFESKEEDIPYIIQNSCRPFDLENAPLLRVYLHYLDTGKTLLVLDSHHIIMDGVSLHLLMSNFCNLYTGKEIGKETLTYTDYAVWENALEETPFYQSSEKFWVEQFRAKELPVMNLPYDFPLSEEKQYKGKLVFRNVSADWFSKLEILAKKQGVSPYMLFLTAFYVVLYQYTSQEKMLVGSPIAGRNMDTLQDMLGMFVNIMPLCVTIFKDQSFTDFLDFMKRYILSALENEPYPYDKILKNAGIPTNSSFIQVVFTYQNILKEHFKLGDTNIDMVYSNTNTAKYPLSVGIIPNTYTFYAEYHSGLFKEDTIENFLDHYLFVLEQILENEQLTIDNFKKLTPKEEKLLTYYNDTIGEINTDTVVSIFEEQVKKQPDSIALICEDKALTYQQLNEKANSLAHFLIHCGIRSNDIVCVMTNRSLETIVGMLAILKAGAAFFNVDPTYPMERTKYYIETSKTKYVLTQSVLKDTVSSIENCIEMDLDKEEIYHKNKQNPNVKIGMQDLSYLIFTSGSTGKPKGVMLNQVGFSNMVKAMRFSFGVFKRGEQAHHCFCYFYAF